MQGSLDGSIKSLIDSKKFGLFRILSFKKQRVYNKFKYIHFSKFNFEKN